MTDRADYVVLQEAGTAFDAQLVVGALRNAGIDAQADDAVAVDEFSMAVHMRGQGVRILVPEGQLAEARDILAALKAAADEQAEGD